MLEKNESNWWEKGSHLLKAGLIKWHNRDPPQTMETLANELVTAVELNDENIVRQLLRTARVDQCNEALIQTCTRGNKDILQVRS